MQVLMRAPRVMQDAGAQRPLDVGRVYTLPEALAQRLISQGAATAVEEAVMVGSPERAVLPPAPQHKARLGRRRP